MSEIIETDPQTAKPAWSPLSARQRRVLGTLMEKSKTTPDAYPMSFAGLTTGCNQKTNRAPISNYSVELVEKIVDELRTLGAVVLIQGSGRVEKVRHCAYQWINLNKIEAAVMTELLLRGEQTVGELRTRASRMEPIADLGELASILDNLKARNLVVALTPPGRGQIVTHNLYPEWELEQVRKDVASGAPVYSEEDDEHETSAPVRTPSTSQSTPSLSERAHFTKDEPPAIAQNHSDNAAALLSAKAEIEELKKTVLELASRLSHLEKELGVTPPTV